MASRIDCRETLNSDIGCDEQHENFDFVFHVRSSHRRCSVKKLFLKISQNSQENICAESLFFPQPATSLKKRPWHRCFLVDFCVIFKSTYCREHRLLLAVEIHNKTFERFRKYKNSVNERHWWEQLYCINK